MRSDGAWRGLSLFGYLIMPSVWTRTFFQHVAVLAAGMLIGLLYDMPFWGFLAAILTLLGWHIYHLYLLERWLRTEKPGPMPDGNGPWSQVLARIEAKLPEDN